MDLGNRLFRAVAASALLAAGVVADEDFLDGNGGFELGNFNSWTVSGGQGWDVVEFDHPGKSGRFYASTCNEIWPGNGGCKNGNGERDTGVLTSAVFTAPGGFLEFRISGFNGPSCDNGLSHISLRRASDHEELRKELLPCQNPFRLHRWSLEDLAGVEVYVRVEDADAAASWAVMAVDGFRLTSEPPDSLDPAAPDSAESLAGSGAEGLTFTSRPDGWQGIYTIEDGEVRQVVPHVDWKLWDPSWSPDGRTLAAVSNRFTSNLEIYLFYFGPDGASAGLRALTDHRGADNQPAWSPDGRQIAFVSDRTGEGDLYLVASTGGDPVRLTQGAPASRPTWSPDGERIAFAQDGDIRSVDPLTGEVTVLSDAPEWEGYPSWSPDGGRIACSADGELAILDLQQGAARRITRGYSHAAYPSWSPDQAFIAFSSNREGAADIYLLELASERIARITHARDTWGHREPVWNPRTSAVSPPPVTVPPRHGSRTKVEARILGEGAAGLILEFTRAIAGRRLDYAWSAVTDRNGYGELTISSDRRVSGFYHARARNRAGEVVGRWTSIPLNEGRRQLVELTLGGGVQVAAIQRLGPATAEVPPEQTGLVAHYPLDGDARDASGNGYHGTMRGPVPARDRFGREDGAVQFHGSDHRIDLPHQVLDGLFDVTVSFWLKTSKSGAQAVLSGANQSNDNEHIIFLNNESQFRFFSHGRADPDLPDCDVDIPRINDGAWHHFAVVRNTSEGNADFFVDGVGYPDRCGHLEYGSLEIEAGGLILGQDQDRLGGGFDSSQVLRGSLDDLRVYARTLSAAEVQALAGARAPAGTEREEAPREEPGLVAHYPFDGDARDASGNGHHGAMTGPVPTQDRFGKKDGAVLFSGSDHRIDLPHQALDGLFDVTISFWLKTSKSGAQAILSGANLSNDNEHIVFFLSESQFRYFSHGRFGQDQLWCDVDVRPINDGAWHHFAVVRNASEGNADFFIDGVGYLDHCGYLEYGILDIDAGGLMLGQDQDMLGGGFDATQVLRGSLDDLRIYGRVLSAAEVQALMDESALASGRQVAALHPPAASGLEPGFPNPFNSSTQIPYRLAAPGPVRLEIYNVLGQLVRTLVDEDQPAGSHRAGWDARDRHGAPVASGVYLAHLQYPGGVQTQRLLYLE